MSTAEAQCPFCGSEVPEPLVIEGGTCPKCFAEIPGEEAVTDPGVEVKAAIERRDRVRASVPRFLAFMSLFLAVGCAGVVALVAVVWPDPQVAEILDFDTMDYPMPDLVGTEVAASVAAAGGTPAERAERLAGSGPKVGEGAVASLGSEPTGGGDLVRKRQGTSEEGSGPAAGRPVSGPSSPGSVSLSLDLPKVRRDDNVVLSDPTAVREMIGERMVEFIPGLQVCYDRRLKQAPSLKGRWRVKFEVQPSGQVGGAAAEGLDRKDRELEACLAEHIEKHWRFSKITIPQPVQRTLKFYPG